MSDMWNDLDDDHAPDPDAAVIHRGAAVPGSGIDESDADARSSLPPGAGTKEGPPSDGARAQPYDEQPIGLRMVDQPLDADTTAATAD